MPFQQENRFRPENMIIPVQQEDSSDVSSVSVFVHSTPPLSPPVDPNRLSLLRSEGLTSADAILQFKADEISSIIGDNTSLNDFRLKLRKKDPLALILGQYPLLHRQPNGKQSHTVTGSRLGFQFDVKLWVLSTLLDKQWLCSSAILGVLAELAVLSPGVQLMSCASIYSLHKKLTSNIPITASDIPILQPNTDTIVCPLNLTGDHWFVIVATCLDGKRFLTLYDSLPSSINTVKEELCSLLDCIVDNHSFSLFHASCWSSIKLTQGSSARQTDSYSCGIITIFNALALAQRQQPSVSVMVGATPMGGMCVMVKMID